MSVSPPCRVTVGVHWCVIPRTGTSCRVWHHGVWDAQTPWNLASTLESPSSSTGLKKPSKQTKKTKTLLANPVTLNETSCRKWFCTICYWFVAWSDVVNLTSTWWERWSIFLLVGCKGFWAGKNKTKYKQKKTVLYPKRGKQNLLSHCFLACCVRFHLLVLLYIRLPGNKNRLD